MLCIADFHKLLIIADKGQGEWKKYQEELPMNDQNRVIGFPAKMHGVDWGFPVAWQGWVVFLGYIALVIVGITLLVTDDRPGLVFPFIIMLLFQCNNKKQNR